MHEWLKFAKYSNESSHNLDILLLWKINTVLKLLTLSITNLFQLAYNLGKTTAGFVDETNRQRFFWTWFCTANCLYSLSKFKCWIYLSCIKQVWLWVSFITLEPKVQVDGHDNLLNWDWTWRLILGLGSNLLGRKLVCCDILGHVLFQEVDLLLAQVFRVLIVESSDKSIWIAGRVDTNRLQIVIEERINFLQVLLLFILSPLLCKFTRYESLQDILVLLLERRLRLHRLLLRLLIRKAALLTKETSTWLLRLSLSLLASKQTASYLLRLGLTNNASEEIGLNALLYCRTRVNGESGIRSWRISTK